MACVSCGATLASQWRGLNGDRCSKNKCKDHAKEERATEATSDPKVAELEKRLTAAERASRFSRRRQCRSSAQAAATKFAAPCWRRNSRR